MKHSLTRWWRFTVISVLTMFSLSGCMVYQIDQSSLDQDARAYHQPAPFKTESPVLAPWLTPTSRDLPAVGVAQSQSMQFSDISGLNFVASLLTLTLIPAVGSYDYTDTFQVVWEGETLATSSASYTIKEYMSLYFPTPMLFMGSLYDMEGLDLQDTQDTINGIHARNVADSVALQQPLFDRISQNDPEALAAFVKSGSAPLFNPRATAQIAALAPASKPLEYHRQYANLSGYVTLLPVELQAWLIGPDGLKGWQIKAALDNGEEEAELLRKVVSSYPDQLTEWNRAARQTEAHYRQWFSNNNPQLITNLLEAQAQHRARWPYYANMSEEHHRILIEQGIPASIVAYMSNTERSSELIAAAKTGPLLDAQGQMLTEAQLLERLVRNDNNGQFMSPFTSDGVLAEWVNLANNANMGATAGSAAGAMAGAYAANRALDFVPFGLGGMVGGAVGSEIGKGAGREAAISASGGWPAIKAASDQSFDSLPNMARYLKRKYGTTANFADAMKAATYIYPEFSSVLASTN